MKKLRWQLVVALLALAAIVVLLLSQQPTASTGVIEADQPVAGGIYSEALIGSLGRLNPVLDFYNPVDYDVDRLLFSSLIRFDHRGVAHNDLAEPMGISQDGKQYNFSLRQNAVWHDGKPVTSADVAFTVDLLRSDDLPIPEDLRSFWKQVQVNILDDKTLQFLLPEPYAPFMDYLTFGVLPKHLLEGLAPNQLIEAPFNLNPVGSGPFRFEGVNVDGDQISGVVLGAFPDYYGQKPYFEKIVFRYFPDDAAALSAYQQGEVMGISQISLASLPAALREPGLNLYSNRQPRLGLVYLNLGDSGLPFFQDRNVRKALLMGINRRWITDRILAGQAIIAQTPIFPESWAYYDGVERVEFDSQKAVELLKKAGYTIPASGGSAREKDGVKLAFELVHPEGEPYTAIAERIRQDWQRLGVEVTLKAVPYDSLVSDYLETRSYQAALAELNFARSPDPDPYPFWHQAQITSGQNYSQWDDRQASEYLEQARVQLDSVERSKRYRNFQVRFGSEWPALPLFYPVYNYAVSDKVFGVSVGPIYDPSDRFFTIAEWYLQKVTGQTAAEPTATP